MHPAVQIRDLLKKLNKTFESIIASGITGLGLTVPQLIVLRHTAQGPRTIGQISEAAGLSYSTISGIIDRLERDGYIHRKRSEEDRRVIWIEHTAKVQDIKKEIPIFQDDYYIQLFAEFSNEQLEESVKTLRMLVKQLEKKVEEKS